jgi:hypothetical protein
MWCGRVPDAQFYKVGNWEYPRLDDDQYKKGWDYERGFGTVFSDEIFLAWNFPTPIAIDTFVTLHAFATNNCVLQVCSDSTNGYDSTNGWITVKSDVDIIGGYVKQTHVIANPTPHTWFRIFIPESYNFSFGSCHFFGTYTDPHIEFWDVNEVAAFTDGFPLVFPNAPDITDYTATLSFKIKNVDSIEHAYGVTINLTCDQGDELLMNHFRLSTDQVTKVFTLTLPTIQPGDFSNVLFVHADIPKAHNPADGYHTFVVDVLELT